MNLELQIRRQPHPGGKIEPGNGMTSRRAERFPLIQLDGWVAGWCKELKEEPCLLAASALRAPWAAGPVASSPQVSGCPPISFTVLWAASFSAWYRGAHARLGNFKKANGMCIVLVPENWRLQFTYFEKCSLGDFCGLS